MASSGMIYCNDANSMDPTLQPRAGFRVTVHYGVTGSPVAGIHFF